MRNRKNWGTSASTNRHFCQRHFCLVMVAAVLIAVGSVGGRLLKTAVNLGPNHAAYSASVIDGAEPGSGIATSETLIVAPGEKGLSNERATVGAMDAPMSNADPTVVKHPVFGEFDRWITGYAAAPPSEKLTLEHQGRVLAAQRREALAREMEADPEHSLRRVVGGAMRELIPASISQQLEETVSGNAEFEVLATGCGTDEEQTTVERYVTLNGRVYRAFVYGQRLQQLSQSNVPVRGIAVGDVIVLEDDSAPAHAPGDADPGAPSLAGSEIQPTSYSGPPSWSKGPKSMLFMRVSFADRPYESISETNAVQLLNQVSEFFQENSFGQASLEATITPVLPLTNTVAWYNGHLKTMLDHAREAATKAGFDTNRYDLDCVFCGSAFAVNQAYIGKKGAWLSSSDPGIAAHEFGHNFGLNHANSWQASDGSTIGSGKNREYGNLFDTMGYGSVGMYAFGAYEKRLLGWVPEEAISTFASSGVYRIYAIDAPELVEGQSYGLRIPKDNQRDYWIEVRAAHGNPELKDGVLLGWSPWSQSKGGTQLLNCNPTVPQQRPLRVGQAFYDLDIGLKIVPLEFFAGTPEAVDVLVNQVYFIPVEVAFGQADSALTKAVLEGSAQLANAPPQSIADNTATVQVEIPESGSYRIWVQTVNRAMAQTSPVYIRSAHGQFASVLEEGGDTGSSWNLAGPVRGGAQTKGLTDAFFFAEGMETLQVQVDGAVDAVRLLITNDMATNLPPVMPEIEAQTISTGSAFKIPFFISAVGQSDSNLVVQATSNNSTLIPETSMSLTRKGSQWELTVSADGARSGSATVTITAKDATGRVFNQSFAVTITNVLQERVNKAEPGSIVTIPEGTSYANLVIDKDLTLEGPEMNVAVLSGSSIAPVLTINAGSTVTVKGLVIENGRGAGIRNDGVLRVIASEIRRNDGPGIANHATLVMEHVTVRDNRAYQGGGLDNWSSATLLNCTIEGNHTENGAGGVLNRKGASLSAEGCCISNNRGVHGNGGGAVANLGELSLLNCTVSNNEATDLAGVEPAQKRVTGGGIWNKGRIALESTTICSNQADWEGGGLHNLGEAEIANCIIAGNTSLHTDASDGVGTFTVFARNLIENPAGWTMTGNTGGVIVGQDPGLAPLDNYGGPTDTVALLPGSPAIDAAECAPDPMSDQRGIERPAGDACDIGAFEFASAAISEADEGSMRVQFELQPHRSYVIEASSDLLNWTVLGEYETGVSPELDVVDPEALESENRFYRVHPSSTTLR